MTPAPEEKPVTAPVCSDSTLRGRGLIERLSDEADLCRNDGADDIARLLDEAAKALSLADEALDAPYVVRPDNRDDDDDPQQVKAWQLKCEPMHAIDEDGWCEWIHPLPGYLMQCCDCGLIHEMEYAIVPSHENCGDTELNEGETKDGVIIFRARRHTSTKDSSE